MIRWIYIQYQKALQSYRRWKYGISSRTVFIGDNVLISSPQLVNIGQNVRIRDYARLKGTISLGDSTDIRNYTLLDARHGKITIGANCSVNDYCVLYGMGEIEIGDDVRIATHTVIVSGDHEFQDRTIPIYRQGVANKKIRIENDVWIASHVSILAGVEIGRGSVIGAGSVVTRSIPPYSVAVGVPARVIAKRE